MGLSLGLSAADHQITGTRLQSSLWGHHSRLIIIAVQRLADPGSPDKIRRRISCAIAPFPVRNTRHHPVRCRAPGSPDAAHLCWRCSDADIREILLSHAGKHRHGDEFGLMHAAVYSLSRCNQHLAPTQCVHVDHPDPKLAAALQACATVLGMS